MSDTGIERLRIAAERAREFTHVIGECRFILRTPTRQQLRECMYRHGIHAGGDVISLALLQSYLLVDHIVGWEGVRECHVVPDAGTAPLPWSRDAAVLVLDAQPDWADSLGIELLARINARTAAIEVAQGN